MSDDLQIAPDLNRPDDGLESVEEFEEITSDEVDRVVEQLEQLMESVGSENIRFHLDEALNSIYYLIYDDAETEEDAETAEDESLSDAA